MEHVLRIVIEKVEKGTNRVVERGEAGAYEIKKPDSVVDFGMRHSEQILLLGKIQDKLLQEQSVCLVEDKGVCPDCGKKLSGNGYQKSNFHSVFSDHKIPVQKYRCNSCGWQKVNSIKSFLGTAVHPDLYKLQCEYGASCSFQKGEVLLSLLSQTRREINNHDRIKITTNAIGEQLSKDNETSDEIKKAKPAGKLIIQIDGGYIRSKEDAKRHFEALCGKIYKPECVIATSKGHSRINNKSCIASAKDDKQKVMKKLLLSASKKQGLTKNTRVTALADGAKNCWSVIKAVEPYCKTLECILDWFHISMKFENLKAILSGPEVKTLTAIKEELWKGNIDIALNSLDKFKTDLTEEKQQKRAKALYGYLVRNKAYIVDYNKRHTRKLVYTTNVAESTVEHLINERHKKKQKMQWTREGAHNVLQISAALASGEWTDIWLKTVTTVINNNKKA